MATSVKPTTLAEEISSFAEARKKDFSDSFLRLFHTEACRREDLRKNLLAAIEMFDLEQEEAFYQVLDLFNSVPPGFNYELGAEIFAEATLSGWLQRDTSKIPPLAPRKNILQILANELADAYECQLIREVQRLLEELD